MKKRKVRTMPLVPLVEAFALPGFVERAAAEASRKYANERKDDAHASSPAEILHIHIGVSRLPHS